MAMTGLDHVNIRTLDVSASAQFYVDLLDLEYRKGPGVMGQQSHWLYDVGGHPIIHFRLLDPGSQSTGPIDHVALSCRGKADILDRLTTRAIKFVVGDGLLPGVIQVFLKDPHGIALELNFSDE